MGAGRGGPSHGRSAISKMSGMVESLEEACVVCDRLVRTYGRFSACDHVVAMHPLPPTGRAAKAVAEAALAVVRGLEGESLGSLPVSALLRVDGPRHLAPFARSFLADPQAPDWPPDELFAEAAGRGEEN